MTILELENVTGLDRATIRYYEKEGLICPVRNENSYRNYSTEDANEIMKIKLLRQLDVPIETIRRLQQGSEDITSVLRMQAFTLENQVTHLERATDICKEISQMDITYKTLNASFYLNRLQQPSPVQSNTASTLTPEETKNKDTYVAYHPVRRFLARMIDYSILRLLVQFVFVMILRIRPFDGLISIFANYGCLLISVPVYAFLLNRFATTPGKWVMGIWVYSYKGEKLSMDAAMQREWLALTYGYGFGIPGLSLWRLYRSYSAYQHRETLVFDATSEHLFNHLKIAKKTLFACIIAIFLALNFVISMDSVCPKYRGSQLTVAEFTENYNFYCHVLDNPQTMNPDGSWYQTQAELSGNTIIVDMNQPDTLNAAFQFHTEGERVTSISFHNTWRDVHMITPIGEKFVTATVTAIMSQPNVDIFQLSEILMELETVRSKDSVHLQFDNIEITWNIVTENCKNYDGMYTSDIEDIPGILTLDFEILIHDAP